MKERCPDERKGEKNNKLDQINSVSVSGIAKGLGLGLGN